VIFNFAINKTSTVQSFLSNQAIPLTVEPRQALDTSMIVGDFPEVLQPIGSFIDYLSKRKIKRFYITRTYALGDILMMVPVIRALRCHGFDPYSRVPAWAKPIADLLDIEAEVVTSHHHSKKGEYGILMDGVVEQDHSRIKLSVMHRVDIYFTALGFSKIPNKLDWSVDFKKLPKLNINTDYIVLQTQGSTKMKQLSALATVSLIRFFEEKGISVVQIREDRNRSIEGLFALIAGAKVLVTMDSGPLWVSHMTRTPVVALLGPTRESERLIYHPLYPKKAVGVALNETIGCKSCFEDTRRCGDNMTCLKIQPRKIFELIEPYVSRFMEK